MSLRLPNRRNESHPIYAPNTGLFTLVMHYGGLLLHLPKANYTGGDYFIYDNVEEDEISLVYVEQMCEENGVLGKKKYYMVEGEKFVQLGDDGALYCTAQSIVRTSRVLELYVEQLVEHVSKTPLALETGVQKEQIVHEEVKASGRQGESDVDSEEDDHIDEEIVEGDVNVEEGTEESESEFR